MTTLSVYVPVTLAETTIRRDADGRYSLNDLHKSAGGEKRHQPSNWLALQQVQELIAELSVPGIPGTEQNQPVARIQGGDPERQGTYVVKELVYAYAMWISPAFHVKVIRTFDAVTTGNHPVAPAAALPDPHERSLHLTRLAIDAARTFGFEGNQAILCADSAVRAITGISPLVMFGQPALVSPVQDLLLNPTEIGLRLKQRKPARTVNLMLSWAGLQEPTHNAKGDLRWALTETGKEFGVYLDTGKKHHDGTPVQQIKWYSRVADIVDALPETFLPKAA